MESIESEQYGKTRYLNNLYSFFKKIYFGKSYKRNIIISLLFIVAFSTVYYKYFSNSEGITYQYVGVKIDSIKKMVEGSGKVASISELEIQQLQNGGKVLAVYVKPGDYVKQGQIIAQLDNRQAQIQLTQAKASYDKIINGSTKEDLDIAKQSLVNARQSYEITRMQQDTAVANARRTLLNTSITPIPVYDSKLQPNTPTISGSYLCTEDLTYTITINGYDTASVATDKGQSYLVRISSVPQALGDCGLYISFDSSKDYLNGVWTIPLPNKVSSNYSTNLNNYNTALQNREIALLNASTTIVNSELSLNQKLAGSRPEDVRAAQASYSSAQLTYENSIIRAPFDGQIGSVSAAVGQQTNSQQGIATIITKDKVAEVALNEIDIVNVKLGQKVELTFDAIQNEKFDGIVSQIDTIGTTNSNVVSFAVKISIPNADERIKSGMSVTANIIVDEKSNILTLPSGAIKTESVKGEEKYFVQRKVSSKNGENVNEKVYVNVGISDNVISEIVGGLSEGDMVVSKTNSRNSTAATQNTFNLFGSRPGGTGGGARTGSTR